MQCLSPLSMLRLQGCADTHIGDVLSRGISGGQAKRTNIGIALISKCGPPSVHTVFLISYR